MYTIIYKKSWQAQTHILYNTLHATDKNPIHLHLLMQLLPITYLTHRYGSRVKHTSLSLMSSSALQMANIGFTWMNSFHQLNSLSSSQERTFCWITRAADSWSLRFSNRCLANQPRQWHWKGKRIKQLVEWLTISSILTTWQFTTFIQKLLRQKPYQHTLKMTIPCRSIRSIWPHTPCTHTS